MNLSVKSPSKRGFRGFVSDNKYVILAFLIPAAIMFAVFAVNGYAPFGNKMVLVADAWHQYYPFLVEYQRMLKEGVSVLYSWNTGGGANFLGVIANYIGSPLYLLSYFVPSGGHWLEVFMMLTVVLRIGVAGGSMALFLRKAFRKNELSIVTFALLYAFCAYIMGYYWNMMWLDTVAILPLVIAGVVSVLRDRKYSLYIISLALSVLFNFYIGYMVCLFVLIFSVCYTLANFKGMKHSLSNAGKMLGFTLIAFMLTAFLTVPAYMALSASDSASDVSGFPTEFAINYGYGYAEYNIKNTLMAIVRTATNLLAFTRPIKMDKGLPNIACGVLSIVLFAFYLFTKKVKLKEKIISVSFLSFLLLSFVINQLNYIWHGMNTPAMVYYRFSFLFSFLLVALAYRAFTLIDSFSKKTFIFGTGVLVLYLAAAFFLQRKVSVLITAAAALVIILLFVLYRKRKLSLRITSFILCLMVVCEVSLTAFYCVRVVGSTKNDDYPLCASEVEELYDVALSKSEEKMFRTEFDESFTLNDGALHSIFGISTFNSMANSSYADFFSEFGLAASKSNNRYEYIETTPVADMFLGIKYLISRSGRTAVDDTYRQLVATTDECTLYENKSALPMGYMADESLASYELHKNLYLPHDGQNALFSLATGIDEDVLELLKPSKELYGEYAPLAQKVEGFEYYYNVDFREKSAPSTEDELAPVYVDYSIEEDGSYYSFCYASEGVDVNHYINGDLENPIAVNQKYACIGAIGKLKSGDTVRVEMDLENNKNNRITTYLLKLDEDVFEAGAEKLFRNTLKVTEWTQTGLKGKITAEESGLLTTSVLYDEGFRAFVDGKEVNITPVGETFIAFPLSEGEHEIELKFIPKGLGAGIAVTIAGIILFALLMTFVAIKRRKEAALNTLCKESSARNTEVTEADSAVDIGVKKVEEAESSDQ
ncbi:MAG: YfhO family protein [Ruminococcus sp.]|nr:YfhO family protein [Ruminococcus sp.]